MKEEERAKPVKSQSSISLSMKSIIDLQRPEGFWLDKSIQQLIDMSGATISATPPQKISSSLTEEESLKAWATLIALWLLETHCAHQKQEWKRIAAKGNRFLKDLGLSYKDCVSLI